MAAAFSGPVGQTLNFTPPNWETIKDTPLGALIINVNELAKNYFDSPTHEMNKDLLTKYLNESKIVLRGLIEAAQKEDVKEEAIKVISEEIKSLESVKKGLGILRSWVEDPTSLNRDTQNIRQTIIRWLITGNKVESEGRLGIGRKVEMQKIGNIHFAVKRVKPPEAKIHSLAAAGKGVLNLLYCCQITDKDFCEIGIELALQTLEDALEKPLDPKTVKNLMQETLKSISLLHDRNIVHLDIKADNIFLSVGSSGEMVKLGDFGTSKIDDPTKKTESEKIHGNIFHASLEALADDSPPITRSSDMWSFGITLFRILTKEFPLGNKVPQRTMELRLSFFADYIYSNKKILEYMKKKDLSMLDLCPPSQALLNLFQEMDDYQKQELSDLIKGISFNQEAIQELQRSDPNGYDLINHLLKINPETRLTAQNALLHRWFLPNLKKLHVHV